MKDTIYSPWTSKVGVSSHEDSAGEFCRVYFSMKLLGFVSKTMKLLLTEFVSQYGKDCRQYIPALTSHSVNKSIILHVINSIRSS